MEAVVLGMLVFVVGILVVANAWAVVDAKTAASAAAREATRAYVKSPSGQDALPSAVQAGHDTLAALGWRGSGQRVELLSGEFSRCSRVTFRVSVPVPIVILPWIGGPPAFTAMARHSEVVDPFRSGVGGRSENRIVDCG